MRVLIFVPISVYLRYQPDFSINMVWYVSILSVTVQAIGSFALGRREFVRKLDGSETEPPVETERTL